MSARHLIGHFVSQPLLTALAEVVPRQVIANGSAGLWNTMMDGMDAAGEEFAYVFFSAGGMGRRPRPRRSFRYRLPQWYYGRAVEAIETAAPLLMRRRELRPDSGGAGRFRGGLGQEMEMEIITGMNANHSCMYDRTGNAAAGLLGGEPGATGEVALSDGGYPHPKSHYVLKPGQRVTLKLPGGGGYGSPYLREPQRVLDDARQGYVSPEAAARDYGVVIDVEKMTIDFEATKARREEMDAEK